MFLMVEPEPATALLQDRIDYQLSVLDHSFFDSWDVNSQSPRYRNEQRMMNSALCYDEVLAAAGCLDCYRCHQECAMPNRQLIAAWMNGDYHRG